MKDKYIYIGFASVITYMLPYIILGENAYITIHDFLDQNVVIMAMLKKTGLLTSLSGVVPNMDGLDRSLFPFFTPFDVKMVCYALLPTYWAIITYTFVYKVVAFVGMYLLLDAYVFKKEYKCITLLLSLGFAFVPFYMELAISGAGFPLITYAFLNLYYNKNKVWSYVAISFYSFNSLLAYGGFFYLAVLGCCLVLDYSRTKKFPKYVIGGAGIMCAVYLLANWGTFYSLFFSDSFVSHRTEWVHSNSLIEDIKVFLDVIFFSQYHAGRLFAFPGLFLFLIIFIFYYKKYAIVYRVAILYSLIVLGIFIGTILKTTHIQLFVTIQFDRFYFFYPSIVFVILATSCYVLLKENKKVLAILFVIYGFVSGAYYDNELKNNTKLIVKAPIEVPTFKQFYATEVFDIIHMDLGTSDNYLTKVVSLGIYPSVAEYNGFWTLDAYRVNYPASYKHKFRAVIEKELDMSDVIRNGFDNWGSRCYVLSSELKNLGNQFLCGKMDNLSVEHLELNTDTLKELGCQYVFSAVVIKNYKDLNLTYLSSYSTPESYWNIKVYQVN